jgi:hypothetical protein
MTAEHVHELPPKGGHVVVDARDIAAVEDGAVIEFVRGGHVVAVMVPVEPDQAWYWTPEWQAKEREFDAARRGMGAPHPMSSDEFLDFLDDQIAAAKAAADQRTLF